MEINNSNNNSINTDGSTSEPMNIEENETDPNLHFRIEELIANTTNLKVLNYKFNFSKNHTKGETTVNQYIALKDMKVKDVFSNLLERNELIENEELKLTFDELFSSLSFEDL